MENEPNKKKELLKHQNFSIFHQTPKWEAFGIVFGVGYYVPFHYGRAVHWQNWSWYLPEGNAKRQWGWGGWWKVYFMYVCVCVSAVSPLTQCARYARVCLWSSCIWPGQGLVLWGKLAKVLCGSCSHREQQRLGFMNTTSTSKWHHDDDDDDHRKSRLMSRFHKPAISGDETHTHTARIDVAEVVVISQWTKGSIDRVPPPGACCPLG